LESGKGDRLSSTSVGVETPVGSGGRLVDQVEPDGQVDLLGNACGSQNFSGSNTGLLQNDWGLDGSSGHDDFSPSRDRVCVALFISEFETGRSGGAVGREGDLADIGSGED